LSLDSKCGQIFCTVAVGLAIKSEPDSSANTTGYDVFLVSTFVVNVPLAFFLASFCKIRNAKKLLTTKQGRQNQIFEFN